MDKTASNEIIIQITLIFLRKLILVHLSIMVDS